MKCASILKRTAYTVHNYFGGTALVPLRGALNAPTPRPPPAATVVVVLLPGGTSAALSFWFGDAAVAAAGGAAVSEGGAASKDCAVPSLGLGEAFGATAGAMDA